VVAIQKGRSQKRRADEQNRVVLFGVKGDQRQHAHGQGQQGGDDFHDAVEVLCALPGDTPKEEITEKE